MKRLSCAAACCALLFSSAASAQAIKNEPPTREFSEEEISAIEMPELAFDETAKIAKDYEKYFYFHRANTSFQEAFADIVECDSVASGISYYVSADETAIQSAAFQYGLAAGVIGGAIASMLLDSIMGSAERRKQRRTNIRNCMYFKSYDRYGLKKKLWTKFNFEEGLTRENARDRERALLVQARVASGPKPDQEVLVP